MNILMWIGIGLLAGGLASRILDDSPEDTLVDILLGVTGSLFSGFLLYELGTRPGGFNLFQVLVLLLSSVLFIWVRNSIKTR
ncbi:MAG: hypothetical protein ABIO02_04595 [Patescibacteria group bacterium]